VSRLTRLKGIEQFLEAAAALKLRYPDVRFLIVGETSPVDQAYLVELQRLATSLGVIDRVTFTGRRSDIPELLAAADVSVMPSLNEALSNVLLESMAAGAPVCRDARGRYAGGARRRRSRAAGAARRRRCDHGSRFTIAGRSRAGLPAGAGGGGRSLASGSRSIAWFVRRRTSIPSC
jgi:hypothetical protein